MSDVNPSVVQGALLLTIAARLSGVSMQSIVTSNVGAGSYQLEGGSLTIDVTEEKFLSQANLALTKRGAL